MPACSAQRHLFSPFLFPCVCKVNLRASFFAFFLFRGTNAYPAHLLFLSTPFLLSPCVCSHYGGPSFFYPRCTPLKTREHSFSFSFFRKIRDVAFPSFLWPYSLLPFSSFWLRTEICGGLILCERSYKWHSSLVKENAKISFVRRCLKFDVRNFFSRHLASYLLFTDFLNFFTAISCIIYTYLSNMSFFSKVCVYFFLFFFSFYEYYFIRDLNPIV